VGWLNRLFRIRYGVWQPSFPPLDALARRFVFICRILDYTRFSLFVLIVGAAVVFFTTQGPEVALNLVDNFWALFFFYVATTIWALQSWFWARLVLNEKFKRSARGRYSVRRGDPHEGAAFVWIASWTPRLFALAAFAVAAGTLAYAEYLSGEAAPLRTLIYLVYAALWLAFLVFRKPATRFLVSLSGREMGEDMTMLGSFFGALTLIVLTGGVGAALVAPVSSGAFLGAGAVLYLALATVAALGGWLVFVTNEGGFPVIAAPAALYVAFSMINDTHAVRSTDREAPAERPRLEEALNRWAAQAPRPAGAGSSATPLVLVASEGGGLRAAHWTVTVLGALEDRDPEFHRKVFAISGVSGGSLGAAAYLASLAAGEGACGSAVLQAGADRKGKLDDDVAQERCHEYRARKALSQDFLGPTLMAGFYNDIYLRVFPSGLVDDAGLLMGRDEALERSWERGWRLAHPPGTPNPLASPFLSLYGDQTASWRPMLMLNATHQQTGERVIVSPADLQDIPAVIDFYDYIDDDRDIALSTAAHNSARFSFVSPAGIIGRDGRRFGHILDGAYFEGFGAETVMDLITALSAMPGPDGRAYRLVVLQIANSPENSQTGDGEGLRPQKRHLLNEVFAPIQGLWSVRKPRGELSSRRVREWVDECARLADLGLEAPGAMRGAGAPGVSACANGLFAGGAEYHELQITSMSAQIDSKWWPPTRALNLGADEAPAPTREPGLGWMLSEPTIQCISEMLRTNAGGVDNFDRFVDLLNALGAQTEGIAPRKSLDCFTPEVENAP